jgi:hypothetical protein
MYPAVGRLALLLFVLVPFGAFSQRSGIGLKAGLGAAQTRSGAMNGRLTAGGTAGIYAPLLAAPRFELQPEILLTALGSGHIGSNDERYAVRSLYVQVPLVAKVYIGSTLNAQIGALAGKLVHAAQFTGSGTRDVTADHRPDEIALLLGAGLDLPSGLDITFRYHNGLTPVLANDELLFPRNQAFLISLGYRIVSLGAPRMQRRRG